MIPIAQLEIWAKLGAITTSASTYATIKSVIEDVDAPYYERAPTSFLQGSYGNHTNVWGKESDVDIVLRCGSIFYYNLDALQEDDKAWFKRVHGDAPYKYADFRTEVLEWLETGFGDFVDPGEKAIRILGDNNRRDADVLPCVKYRKYHKFDGTQDASGYIEGITFFKPDGTQIVNYPEQHYENCVSKHQKSDAAFKGMVRIFKNMRNRMSDEGLIEAGIAPSYYIEGLLYNVPTPLFTKAWDDSFVACYNWIAQSNKDGLKCANMQSPLIRSGSPIAWDPGDSAAFISAIADFWNAY